MIANKGNTPTIHGTKGLKNIATTFPFSSRQARHNLQSKRKAQESECLRLGDKGIKEKPLCSRYPFQILLPFFRTDSYLKYSWTGLVRPGLSSRATSSRHKDQSRRTRRLSQTPFCAASSRTPITPHA